MKEILMLLNIMAFLALLMIGFVKTGSAEKMIKEAAKNAVTEIVKEEIKKQLPSVPKMPWKG